MNGDGSPDLVTGGSGEFTVLLNRGDGTLRFGEGIRIVYQLPNRAQFQSLLASDLNGDGKPDLVAGQGLWDRPGLVHVFLNRGDGTFEEAAHRSFGGEGVFTVLASDLNGDGKPDLVAMEDGAIGVLLNRGDGTFEEPVLYNLRTAWPGRLNSLLALDLNGDGSPDIVATAWLRVVVLLNRGDGTFEEPVEVGAGIPSHSLIPSQHLTASDFDGDNRPDLTFLTPRGLWVLRSRTPVSLDLDRNGIPDECQGRAFRRGDSNTDGATDISDAVATLSFFFLGNQKIPCQKAADTNDDGTVDLSDGVFLLSYLFLGEEAPAEPLGICGVDPTADELTCDSFPACQ